MVVPAEEHQQHLHPLPPALTAPPHQPLVCAGQSWVSVMGPTELKPSIAKHCQALPSIAKHCQALPSIAKHCQALPSIKPSIRHQARHHAIAKHQANHCPPLSNEPLCSSQTMNYCPMTAAVSALRAAVTTPTTAVTRARQASPRLPTMQAMPWPRRRHAMPWPGQRQQQEQRQQQQ